MSRKQNSRGNRGRRNGNGRSPKSCDRDYKGKDMREDTKQSSNDPAWYAKNQTILKDAASFPFSYVTGASDVHDPSLFGESYVRKQPIKEVPGICSLHVYPCVGTADKATDPVNVAAQSIYSFIRHANSGHANYDAPDLMLYFLGMANVYSALIWCERLYGYALTYDQRNRYIPNELIRTNNVDPVDLVNNLANFRFWINALIVKIGSFAVPATMSIFSRMSFMYSSYYVEGTSIKDQLYQFVPEGFYKFSLDNDDKGQLEWVPFDYSNSMSVSDIEAYVEDLFAAIWDQEDFGIMSGDVLKAYGDGIIKVPQIPEIYTLLPTFDSMVLTQMKNADLVRITPSNVTQTGTNNYVTQYIVPRAYTTSDKWIDGSGMGDPAPARMTQMHTDKLCDYQVLTVDTDDPTPEIVIEASRLKVAYDKVNNYVHAGSEVIVGVTLTVEPGTDIIVDPFVATVSKADGSCNDLLAHMLASARNFHYMPSIWVADTDYNGNTYCVTNYFDIDNFTVMTYQDVYKLHQAAVINMFDVPSVAKV